MGYFLIRRVTTDYRLLKRTLLCEIACSYVTLVAYAKNRTILANNIFRSIVYFYSAAGKKAGDVGITTK
jgi:hypothetical protein